MTSPILQSVVCRRTRPVTLHPRPPMKTIMLALLCCLAQSAFAASPFPDHLLKFKDMHLNAVHSPSVFWVTDDVVVLNASTEAEYSSEAPGVLYVAVYNLKRDSAITFATNARIACLYPEKGFGVIVENLPTAAFSQTAVYRRIRVTREGGLARTEDPATSEDCHSIQYNKNWGSQYAQDLGPGKGVLLTGNESLVQPLIHGSYISFIDEVGVRTEFPQFKGSSLQVKGDLPWRRMAIVGTTPQGALVWQDSKLSILPIPQTLTNFFKSPSWKYTRHGYIVGTGVGDPYNGDTFYFREDMATPVRIYKYQGFGDDIGQSSISPNGCIWLTTHWSNDGWRNRLLASLTAGKLSLHYANLCNQFGERN